VRAFCARACVYMCMRVLMHACTHTCVYTCMHAHPQRLSSRTNSTLKVWNADTATLLRTLSGHSSSVTCVRWTGNNFLVSSSQDKTMKVCAARPPDGSQQCEAWCQLQLLGWCVSVSVSVCCVTSIAQVWDPETGIMVRSLDMHGHWINSIALSSDHVMRNSPATEREAQLTPAQRWEKATGAACVVRCGCVAWGWIVWCGVQMCWHCVQMCNITRANA